MATRVPAPGELLCVDKLERNLTDLSERVELKKEEVRRLSTVPWSVIREGELCFERDGRHCYAS